MVWVWVERFGFGGGVRGSQFHYSSQAYIRSVDGKAFKRIDCQQDPSDISIYLVFFWIPRPAVKIKDNEQRTSRKLTCTA